MSIQDKLLKRTAGKKMLLPGDIKKAEPVASLASKFGGAAVRRSEEDSTEQQNPPKPAIQEPITPVTGSEHIEPTTSTSSVNTIINTLPKKKESAFNEETGRIQVFLTKDALKKIARMRIKQQKTKSEIINSAFVSFLSKVKSKELKTDGIKMYLDAANDFEKNNFFAEIPLKTVIDLQLLAADFPGTHFYQMYYIAVNLYLKDFED